MLFLDQKSIELMADFTRSAATLITETFKFIEKKPLKISMKSIELTVEGSRVGEVGVKNRDEGLLSNATEKFREAIREDITNFQAHFYLAQTLYIRCRVHEALVAVGQGKSSARTKNDIKRITSYEAMLYGALDQWESSIKLFDELIAKNLADGTVRYNRSEALLSLGKKEEGKNELRRAFEIEDDENQLAKFVEDVKSNPNFRKVLQFPEIENLINEYEQRISGSERFFNLPKEFLEQNNKKTTIPPSLKKILIAIVACSAAITALIISPSELEKNISPSDNLPPVILEPSPTPKHPIEANPTEIYTGVGHGSPFYQISGIGHDFSIQDDACCLFLTGWNENSPTLKAISTWHKSLQDFELPIKLVKFGNLDIAIDKDLLTALNNPVKKTGVGHA